MYMYVYLHHDMYLDICIMCTSKLIVLSDSCLFNLQPGGPITIPGDCCYELHCGCSPHATGRQIGVFVVPVHTKKTPFLGFMIWLQPLDSDLLQLQKEFPFGQSSMASREIPCRCRF